MSQGEHNFSPYSWCVCWQVEFPLRVAPHSSRVGDTECLFIWQKAPEVWILGRGLLKRGVPERVSCALPFSGWATDILKSRTGGRTIERCTLSSSTTNSYYAN